MNSVQVHGSRLYWFGTHLETCCGDMLQQQFASFLLRGQHFVLERNSAGLNSCAVIQGQTDVSFQCPIVCTAIANCLRCKTFLSLYLLHVHYLSYSLCKLQGLPLPPLHGHPWRSRSTVMVIAMVTVKRHIPKCVSRPYAKCNLSCNLPLQGIKSCTRHCINVKKTSKPDPGQVAYYNRWRSLIFIFLQLAWGIWNR